MPSNIIKTFAEKSGKSEKEVEQMWDKAKGIAAESGRNKDYAYITGILKKMLKINESASSQSFKEYLSNIVDFYED